MTAGSASSESNCLTSMPVSSTKSLTYLDFGGAAEGKVNVTLSCRRAEELRSEIFISGKVTAESVSNREAINKALGSSEEQLAAAIKDLNGANEQLRAKAVLKATSQAALLASVLAVPICAKGNRLGCAAIAAGAGLVTLIEHTSDTLSSKSLEELLSKTNELSTKVSSLREQISSLKTSQEAIETNGYQQAFNAMCTAIKKQCLD